MKKYLPVLILIVLGIVSRFIPHLPNFTPIGAVAIFGSLYLPKKYAFTLPMLAMFVSDIFIGFYSWQIMLSVYLGFMIMGVCGYIIRDNISFIKVSGSTLVGSFLFFLITNAAVWAFGTMYAHNYVGLIDSYSAGLPFFRNSLFGDIFYTFVLVGGYELVKKQIFYKRFAVSQI